MSTIKLGWKIYTKGMIEELMTNPHTGILAQPMEILFNLLQCVSKRAIELDDYELNCLMLRLSLYSISDPSHADFDQSKVAEYLGEASS